MQVIKRDGRISEYNDERIIKAITLAMSHTTGGDIMICKKSSLEILILIIQHEEEKRL